MGQRSQIYVRIYNKENPDCPYLIARYFQWNYGQGMISRARHTLDFIKEHKDYISYYTTIIPKYLEVNFDTKGITDSSDLFQEYCKFGKDHYSLADYLFTQDNNDGTLWIDIRKNGIKYAFLDCVSPLGLSESSIEPLSANEYMNFDVEGWNTDESCLDENRLELVTDNIKAISKAAKLMTAREIWKFVNTDYHYMLEKYEHDSEEE